MYTQRFGIYTMAITVLSVLLLLGLIITSVANAENICDPPIEEININDIEQYMECNAYVSSIINSIYVDVFPDKILSNTDAEYDYHYACRPLGDPEFSFVLKLCFYDIDDYETEKNRIFDLLGRSQKIDMPSTEIYFISGSPEDAIDYFDDQIYDGKSYNFEMVSFDDNKRVIEYYMSQLWEGQRTSSEQGLLYAFVDWIREGEQLSPNNEN